MSVTDLNTKRLNSPQPTCSGKLRCVDCQHEWVAVWPVGTVTFECPQCGTFRGVPSGLCAPGPGEVQYGCLVCDENDVFFVTTKGVYCCRCGQFTDFAALAEAAEHSGA